MGQNNKCGGNFLPRAVEAHYANALTDCLILARDISIDAITWPVMESECRLKFMDRVSKLHDDMEAAVLKRTGNRYQLPEIYR